ncbi:MAG: hypothetical protein R3B54_16995 [Bdellovibrionota bacterium]
MKRMLRGILMGFFASFLLVVPARAADPLPVAKAAKKVCLTSYDEMANPFDRSAIRIVEWENNPANPAHATAEDAKKVSPAYKEINIGDYQFGRDVFVQVQEIRRQLTEDGKAPPLAVALGRSLSPFRIVAQNSADSDAFRSLPLSKFKDTLSPAGYAELKKHLDIMIGPVRPGQDIVLADYIQTGGSLRNAKTYVQKWLSEKGGGTVRTVGVTTDKREPEFDYTITVANAHAANILYIHGYEQMAPAGHWVLGENKPGELAPGPAYLDARKKFSTWMRSDDEVTIEPGKRLFIYASD